MNQVRRVVGRVGVAVVVVLTLLTATQQLQAADEVNAATEASIRELIQLTGGANLGTQVMSQMIEAMKKNSPNVPEEFWARFMTRVKPDDLVRLYIPIYAKHFSQSDIREMIAFYKSPLGRKVLAELPAVTRESMSVGQEWGKQLGEKIVAELRAEGYLKP